MTTTNVRLTDARRKAEEAQKQIVEAQKVMAESVKEVLSDGMNAIFQHYPFLGSVHWTQYTPYFNDGEPCVFSAHFYPGINSLKDIEDGTESKWSEEHGEDFASKCDEKRYVGYDSSTRTSKYEPNDAHDPAYTACENEITALFKGLQGESTGPRNWDVPSTFDMALLQAFGDHARVVITRSGIEVDTCDHD